MIITKSWNKLSFVNNGIDSNSKGGEDVSDGDFVCLYEEWLYLNDT